MSKDADLSANQLLRQLSVKVAELESTVSLSNQATQFVPAGDVGRAIVKARQRQDMNQQMLAELSGVGIVTISKVENGHPSVKLETLLTIMNSLGLKLWVG